jgi:hypothetical protein
MQASTHGDAYWRELPAMTVRHLTFNRLDRYEMVISYRPEAARQDSEESVGVVGFTG